MRLWVHVECQEVDWSRHGIRDLLWVVLGGWGSVVRGVFIVVAFSTVD